MKAIATFGLFMLVLMCSAQEDRPQEHIAQVWRYSPGNINIISIGAVIVTDRHVLVANTQHLRDTSLADLRVIFSSQDVNIESDDVRIVQNVFYNENNANVAIVEANWAPADNLPIRSLHAGALVNQASCQIFFFPENSIPLRTSVITIRITNCPENNAWCGEITNPGTCSGFVSAPVICAEQNRVAGINFHQNVCQAPGNLTHPVASLVNVADISEWIDYITIHQYSSASMKVASLFGLFVGVLLSKVF